MLNKKAFTLMEIVVSIPILLILIVSLLDFVMYNLNAQSRIKNDFMLNELAKEGIEVITFMRDANYVKGEPNLYDTGINFGGAINEQIKYQLYYDKTKDINERWSLIALDDQSANINSCIADGTCALKMEATDEFYKQNKSVPGTATDFYRLITIEKKDDFHFFVTSETAYKDSILVKNKVKLVKEVWDIK